MNINTKPSNLYFIHNTSLSINRYLASVNRTTDPLTKTGKDVIAMPLYGFNTNYTYGAIRNTQLLPIYFPEWTLRIYTPHPDSAIKADIVPQVIIQKLLNLGAQVFYVNTSAWVGSLKHMAHLVSSDNSVDRFLIRHANHRFDDRQSNAVREWKNSGAIFHCIRDHPSHAHIHIVPGLYGAKNKQFSDKLQVPVMDIIAALANKNRDFLKEHGIRSNSKQLEDVFWDVFGNHLQCHDSTFCGDRKFKGSVHFRTDRRIISPYIGEKFDAYQYSIGPESRWETINCPTPNTL